MLGNLLMARLNNAFTVVSLHTHRMVGLPALVAVMIATSGDEAFVMFALFPDKALLLRNFIENLATFMKNIMYIYSPIIIILF